MYVLNDDKQLHTNVSPDYDSIIWDLQNFESNLVIYYSIELAY
jgi:hypothetical protein